MRDARIFHNAACLQCRRVRIEMIRYGALIFCDTCFEELRNELVEENGYSYWLKRWKEKNV